MSDALYSTRLRWCNGRGVAMLHGKPVALTEAPTLCEQDGPVAEIDYVPEVHCHEVRHQPHGRMEEMRADEIRAADALLRRMAGP